MSDSKHGLDYIKKVNFQNHVLENSFERAGMKMGGVAIYRNKTLRLHISYILIWAKLSLKIKYLSGCEIKVDLGVDELLIDGVYRSPDSNVELFFDKLNQYLVKARPTDKKSLIIIIIYFNINSFDNNNTTHSFKNLINSKLWPSDDYYFCLKGH